MTNDQLLGQLLIIFGPLIALYVIAVSCWITYDEEEEDTDTIPILEDPTDTWDSHKDRLDGPIS